jgi:CheY-like chemotaxis protein
VEKVKVARYDLIFMDINMPVMDGITATRLIREQPNHYKEHLPIIALTSNGSSSDIVKSLDAGLNEHVVKPLRLKRLKVILQAYSLLD